MFSPHILVCKLSAQRSSGKHLVYCPVVSFVIHCLRKEVLLVQYDIYKMLLALKEQNWLDSFDLLRLARLDPPDIISLTAEGILTAIHPEGQPEKYRLSVKGRLMLLEYEKHRADAKFNRISSIIALFFSALSLAIAFAALVVGQKC